MSTTETPDQVNTFAAERDGQSDACPILPRPAAAAGRTSESLRALRRFHFTPQESPATPPAEEVSPALLHAAAVKDQLAGPSPVFLGPAGAGEGSLCLALPDLLARGLPEPLPGLERHVRGLAASESGTVDARELVEKAGRALAAEADEEEAERVRAALEGLLADVPAGGRFVPYGEQLPLQLLVHAAASRLLPARTAFREEVRVLADQAETLARAASGKGEESAEAMGQLGNRFIDPSALADMVSRRRGRTSLTARQEERLRADAKVLADFLAESRPPGSGQPGSGHPGSGHPVLVLVHDGGPEALPAGDDWRVVKRDDPCAAAAELFDEQAERIARVVRAAHRVRLAAAGTYDPERHDPWLDQLDWQAFSRAELRVLPPVVALVTADQVARDEMASLSHLLLSGRPVQVLVLTPPGANPGAESLTGFRFEPAYLGLSHREVLVQQTAAARPAHMMRGFLRALAATRAGLHVVASFPGLDAAERWRAEILALQARAHPLFHWDPEAGSSWADRLDFSFNPDPEDDWPVFELAMRRDGGGDDALRLALTFADFALLDPAHARHFHPVPDDVPEAELVPMAELCAAPPDAETSAIPFVWAVDGESRLRRLAVSRPLALACRDRLDFWRTLQELAGVRSEYARRAAERARQESESAAREERVRLETLHAEELERLRREAARDVVDRLTASLLEVDLSTLATLVPPATRSAGLGALQGKSVEEVSAALLQLLDPATLDAEVGPEQGGERVGQVASELLRALGPDSKQP